MMDLIDRNAVLNRYQEICNGSACMDCPFNKDGCAFEKLILESAVVEAEPVRHGRWTVTYLKHIELANDEGHVYIHFAKCSECGNEAIMQFVDYNESFKEWYTDYCPHCGAKNG